MTTYSKAEIKLLAHFIPNFEKTHTFMTSPYQTYASAVWLAFGRNEVNRYTGALRATCRALDNVGREGVTLGREVPEWDDLINSYLDDNDDT